MSDQEAEIEKEKEEEEEETTEQDRDEQRKDTAEGTGERARRRRGSGDGGRQVARPWGAEKQCGASASNERPRVAEWDLEKVGLRRTQGETNVEGVAWRAVRVVAFSMPACTNVRARTSVPQALSAPLPISDQRLGDPRAGEASVDRMTASQLRRPWPSLLGC
jgi:hypothetical protein